MGRLEVLHSLDRRVVPFAIGLAFVRALRGKGSLNFGDARRGRSGLSSLARFAPSCRARLGANFFRAGGFCHRIGSSGLPGAKCGRRQGQGRNKYQRGREF